MNVISRTAGTGSRDSKESKIPLNSAEIVLKIAAAELARKGQL